MMVQRILPATYGCFAGAAVLCAIGLFLIGGCDTTFPVYDPSASHVYSIYGVINPAQDTQWIRVEPVPVPTAGGAPKTIDANVTLENLATDQTWTLHDSLMVVQTEPQHNFWTAASIAPGTSYRLVVRRSDGATARATTTTPERAPLITVTGTDRDTSSETATDSVGAVTASIYRVHELAGVHMRYWTLFGSVHTFSHYESVTQIADGYRLTIPLVRDLDRIGLENLNFVDSAHAVAYGGGPDWPEWAQYHDATIKEVTRLGKFSNVKGGFGTFRGVYSTAKRVF